jgi:hypothetical protein
MDVLWMGLTIFVIVIVSFVLILGMTKGVAYVTNGDKKDPLSSKWISMQVYSGDDSLGHPDLKKISELQEDKLIDSAEKI